MFCPFLKSSIDLSCNCGMIACDKNQKFSLTLWATRKMAELAKKKQRNFLEADLKNGTWDPGLLVGPKSETQHPKCGAWDLGPWKRIFRKFSQFFLKSGDYELIHVLFAFILCFLLPYHTAYALLIFYHLNVLLLPSYCKNFHHAAAMKSLNFRENQW